MKNMNNIYNELVFCNAQCWNFCSQLSSLKKNVRLPALYRFRSRNQHNVHSKILQMKKILLIPKIFIICQFFYDITLTLLVKIIVPVLLAKANINLQLVYVLQYKTFKLIHCILTSTWRKCNFNINFLEITYNLCKNKILIT